MSLTLQNTQAHWQHKITFSEYSLQIAPETTYEQLGAAGDAIKGMVRRVPFYAVAWSHEMIRRGWMTLDDIAAFWGRQTKTVSNWLLAFERLPKLGEMPPHPDFSLSHYLAMATLSDGEFDEAVAWVVGQETIHNRPRIASVARYEMRRDGGNPYPDDLPAITTQTLIGTRKELYDTLDDDTTYKLMYTPIEEA